MAPSAAATHPPTHQFAVLCSTPPRGDLHLMVRVRKGAVGDRSLLLNMQASRLGRALTGRQATYLESFFFLSMSISTTRRVDLSGN